MKQRMGLGALALVAMIVALSGTPGVALGDGDPGSDVLVNQSLFVAGDAGVSVAQQEQVQRLLSAAASAGMPVRVAIIAQPAELGALTALWHAPRAYAKFLGAELSLTYTKRLLVVMPNGLGLFWLGHSDAARLPGAGRHRHCARAVRTGGRHRGPPCSLARGAGVTLSGQAQTGAGASTGAGAAAGGTTGSGREIPHLRAAATSGGSAGRSTDTLVAAIAAAVVVVLAAFFGLRAVRRRGPMVSDPAPAAGGSRRGGLIGGRALPGFATLAVLAMVALVIVLNSLGGSARSQLAAIDTNPYLDPGTPLSSRAPDFTLDDQFGRPVSLRSYRGKVVLLAFTDSECTTICP